MEKVHDVIPQRKEIVEIINVRKRNGSTQYNVVFSDTKDGKSQWIKPEEGVTPQLIEQFNESLKDKKKNPKKGNANTGRRIQKIAGARKIENDLYFVVKFTDSDQFENVPHSDMKSRYTKSLLGYYEQHIKVINP